MRVNEPDPVNQRASLEALLECAEPRHFYGVGAIRFTGRGRIVLELKNSGCLVVRRGRKDDFFFDGEGTPRHVSSACILLANASGSVVVTGEEIEVEFEGGVMDAEVRGAFRVEPGGRKVPPKEEAREPPRPDIFRRRPRIRSRYHGAA